MKVVVACVFLVVFVQWTASIHQNQIFVPPEKAQKVLGKMWRNLGKRETGDLSAVYENKVQDIEVATPMGRVKGIISKTCRGDTRYAAFFGMPYAKPPVGKLRFRETKPADPWRGVWDGTYERPSCLQFQGTEDEREDCLYVNVYTPAYKPLSSALPVMVFIHGGAFISGSSNSSLYGPDFIVNNKVVLVTFNYRLGVLGFLSFHDERVPGNAGLKDQTLALKWVQKNIRSFGGDPRRVTIFGNSAGSASVNYHLLSKGSRGLFHGAIMESGTVTCPWAYTSPDHIVRLSQTFAEKVGCTKGKATADDVLECLRKVPGRKLADMEQQCLSLEDFFSIRPFAFVPTFEPDLPGAFITESPWSLMCKKRFHRVPIIIGTNSREGLIALPAMKEFDPIGFAISIVGLNLSFFFPYEVRKGLNLGQLAEIHFNLKWKYFGWKPVNIFTRNNLIDLITDSAFAAPTELVARQLSDSSAPVYSYVFGFNGTYNVLKIADGLTEERGTDHSDELGYLFYTNFFHPQKPDMKSEEERKVAELSYMWTNFAKTGVPADKTNALIKTKWIRFKAPNYSYLDIDRNMVVRNAMDKPLLDYWLQNMEKLSHPASQSLPPSQ